MSKPRMNNTSTLAQFIDYSTYHPDRTSLSQSEHYTWVIEMIGSWAREMIQEIITEEKKNPSVADNMGAANARGLTRLIAELKAQNAETSIIEMLNGTLSILINLTMDIHQN